MRIPRVIHGSPDAKDEGHRLGGRCGLALVKCIIETDGWLSHCRITKGLPYLDAQILASMMTWRYTPVLYKGRPKRVEIILPLRVPVPRPPRDSE
jgi:Gram-negative bacterial TonB protein C-terminal